MAGFKSQFSKWLFALQVFKLSINPHRLVSRGWWLTRGPQTGWRTSGWERKKEAPWRGARNAGGCSYIQYIRTVKSVPVWFFSFFLRGLKITKQKTLAIMYSTCLEEHKEKKHRQATTHLKYSVSDLQLFCTWTFFSPLKCFRGRFWGGTNTKAHTLNWRQICEHGGLIQVSVQIFSAFLFLCTIRG